MKKIEICITDEQYKIIEKLYRCNIKAGIQEIILSQLYEYTEYNYYEDKEIKQNNN